MTGPTPASTHILSPCEIEQFERDGFIVVRRLADQEMCARMVSLTQAHVAAPVPPVEDEVDTQYEGAPVSHDSPGGKTVRRLLHAFARDALFREWAQGDAIAGRLRQLLGPSLALSQAHHNCVMTKHPAFSSVTGWHQDIRYWSFRRPDLVSTWLALGPERADNGGLLLVPGLHRLDLRREQFDKALFFRPEVEENRAILARQVVAELDAGDVLFFHARLLHAAGNNRTALTKFAVVFTFHAQDNAADPGTRSSSVPDVPLVGPGLGATSASAASPSPPPIG